MLLLFIVSGVLLLSGCSTTSKLRPGERTEKKNRAADYAAKGAHYFDDAAFNKALDLFFLALKENILVDSDPGIIESYNSIGKTYLAAGKIDSAETYYSKALEVAVAYNDPHLLLRCKNNKGEILLARKDYTSALALFKEAYSALSHPEKDADAAVILHNIGVAEKRLGNYAEAETYLLKSRALNKKNNRWKEMALDSYTLASLYSKMNHCPEAMDAINKALELDKLIENSYGIAGDLYARGILQQKAGSPKEAYYSFKRAALIFESLGLPSALVNCLTKLEYLAKKLSYHDDLILWQTTRKKLENGNGTPSRKQ